METIEMFVDEENEQPGIFAVSVVENPAIKSAYIALSKERLALAEVDAEKQILMGALLIPNKEILRRKDDGTEYKIFFSENTVRRAMEVYMKNGFHNQTTDEHEKELEGNVVCEMWIKEDMVHDKSAKYGLDDPVGSLMITMKIPNKDEYNRIKNDKNGFSLEGNFTDKIQMQEVEKITKKKQITLNSNNTEQMSKGIIKRVTEFFSNETVKLEQTTLENGAVLEADVFEAGQPVMVVNGDERVPVPPNTYKTTEGMTLVVKELGIIASYGASEEVEVEKEQEMETEDKAKKVVESTTKETHFEETKAETATEETKEEVLFSDAQTSKLKEMFSSWMAELSAEAKDAKVEDTTQELSAVEEEVKPETHSPEKLAAIDIPYEKMTNVQKMLYNRNN